MTPNEIGSVVGVVGGLLGLVSWWQVQRDRRRKREDEQAYQAWVRGKVESLMAGPGNFIKIGADEHAWAARAYIEGRLRWGPIGEIPGVMLPETALDE